MFPVDIVDVSVGRIKLVFFGKLILIVVKDLVEVKIFAITTSYIVTTIWCYIVFGNTHVMFGCMSYTYVAGASIRIAEYT